MMLKERLTLEMNPSARLKQNPKHLRDKYAYLQLNEDEKSRICFTKLTNNSTQSDYRPSLDHPWVQQFTAHEKVNMVDADGDIVFPNSEDGTTGISTDAGIIMTFHGTPSRIVALDPLTADILPIETAELREETFGTQFPRFTEWGFRLHEVIYTDGPERNARLHESAEELRAGAEAKSLTAQEAFYTRQATLLQSIIAQIAQSGGKVDMDAIVAQTGEKAPLETDNEDLKAAMEEWELTEKDAAPVVSGGKADMNITVTSGNDKKGRK
jgi:hypothetical protein